MRIAITGSSGLVGSSFVPFARAGGHEVVRLVRGQPAAGEGRWAPDQNEIDASTFAGCNGVVHLAGENIAAGRWNTARKQRIRDSRVVGTRLLAETLARLPTPPRVLVCASAIGFYGDRGDELLTEDASPGSGFLAEVCQAWEAAAEPARQAGIRVVHLRFGMILSPRGGALARMLTPFRLGVGGVVGSGRQYWSWMGLDDAVGAIHHALMTDSLVGAVNAVAPQVPTCGEFTRALGRVLHRPTFLPLPAFAARLALGELADELLLASARVVPRRLEQSGYAYRHPELEGALRHLLGK